MAQKNKRFGLGMSFEDLCETNELSLSHLEEIIDSLSLEELHSVLDELSESIDGFITKYEAASFDSLEDLLQASIQSQMSNYQPKPTTSDKLFEGLGDLLENE